MVRWILVLALLVPLVAQAAPPVNLAHLDFLRERRVRPGGSFGLAPISLVWVYCERDPATGAYTRVHAHGAANQGPELEGIACVDDVARAVLVWMRELVHGEEDDAVRQALRESLRFLLGMEVPGVGYANFVDRELRRNLEGKTSRPGLGWWSARVLRALAESEPLLIGPLERRVRQARLRLLTLLEQGLVPGELPDQGTDLAAVWLLGLTVDPGPREKELIRRLAEGLLAAEAGRGRIPSWLGSREFMWHGWGSYQPAALARASEALGDPRYLAAAERLLDRWYSRMLLTGIPYLVEGEVAQPFPRIAYAAQTAVESAYQVYQVTGEERYLAMAGLFAGWFLGANRAGRAVYDPGSGRTYDDVRAGGLNLNSGAESTIEGLLVIQKLRQDEELDAYSRLRPVEEESPWPVAAGASRRWRGDGRELTVILEERGFRIEGPGPAVR